MFPQYVAHSMEGRARLRHPALGETAVRSAVQAALGKEQDVLEVRPGACLLYTSPSPRDA